MEESLAGSAGMENRRWKRPHASGNIDRQTAKREPEVSKAILQADYLKTNNIVICADLLPSIQEAMYICFSLCCAPLTFDSLPVAYCMPIDHVNINIDGREGGIIFEVRALAKSFAPI